MPRRSSKEQATESGGSEPPDFLTSSEVASLFGVDRRTVILWAKRGRLTAVRTPGGQHRFRAAEIEQVLRQQIDDDR